MVMEKTKNNRKPYWFFNRYPIENWVDFFKKKVVPIHQHTIWYYLGGATLFLFAIQVVTGILLLLYYRPTEEAAFASVQFIMTKVRFGWLIRSVHSWSANLMVLSCFIHMFSTFLLKAYRYPREFTWITGSLLLFLTMAFGFSGYLLPWNEISYFGTRVATESIASIPVIGHYLLVFFRGGEDVSGATLTRFFGFHVAVLPLLLTMILIVHLLMVQVQGMSVPLSVEKKPGPPTKTSPFFPNFILKDCLGWLITLGLLAMLAALYPWELGVKADPFAPAPAGIKPEWYFLFLFQTLKLIPATIFSLSGEMIAVMTFGVVGILWALVPFIDRRANRGMKSPLFTILGIGAIAYIAVMTAIAYIVSKK